MNKRIITMLLSIVMLLGLLPTMTFAASTPEESLGEVDIYNGGTEMSYLSINGRIRSQIYTYYNFDIGGGKVREIPAYCVNPNTAGVPQTVAPGESIEYLADERASDPKVMGIVANGYPTRGLGELKLENKYHAYYATKMALWCYILPNWDINNLKVNPNLTGLELTRAQAILSAAKDIYARGTAWNETLSPEITCTPDRENAYPVTIDGKEYKQQVFTFWSKTWVCDYSVSVAFSDPSLAPAGTRIVDMDNKDITTITTSGTGDGYAGKFKVLYPVDSIADESGSVKLSFVTNVYKYAIFYAVCAEKDKYGEIQNYMVDTDPTLNMKLSAYSNFNGDSIDAPDIDTGLKILKLETGSEFPLSGALFEVIGPDGATVGTFSTNGDGEIMIPLTLSGNYTIIEKAPPANHLLGENTTQNVNVEYGRVANLTFYNAPYGTLRIEKISNTGMYLPGAVITVEHIVSGKTYTATTNFSGVAIFTELQPGAYRVQEKAAPAGWKLDDTIYTTTVVSGETTTIPIVNEELPGLRIIKYDRVSHTSMPNVTFEIFRDTISLGKFKTDEFGEILLTNVQPGTYRAVEVDTGEEGHILDTTPQEVELAAGDGIKELLFFNDMKPGLRLVKVDSNDPSKVIANAVFEIKSVDGSYGPEEFTTDEHGEIDLTKLPAGAYVVTEKSCPGYIIDQAQRIIQLDPNENAQFVFTNSSRPSLQLIKLSADGTRLAGVTFRIAKIEDGSHYLDRTTNTQGEILISDLEPGVYSVKETATLTDHILDLREHHVELFPGQTSTIVLQNSKRPNLIVYKYDADTGESVSNTVFQVRAADGHSVDEIRTDATGRAVLGNLLPGVYEITEKSVPEPYLLDAPSQLVTLYPNRDHTVYFENHKKPSLTVNKIDSITGAPLQGAKFQVWYGSNNTETGELNDLGFFYSDENGQFTLDAIKDGWYKVTELEPVAGYAIRDPATQECFVEAGKGKVLTFENTPLSALVVWKYDSVTGVAVQGAVFQVKYLSGTSGTGGTVIGTYKTGINGSFTVTGLREGTYIVEELASDSGHVIDTPPQTAYISGKEQDVVQLYFGNSPKGSLLIKKIDSVSHKPLSDVEFMVTTSDGAVVGTANGKFITDAQGSILISNLEPGLSVVVKETIAKDGYLLDDTPQTIKIIAGETVSLEFRNQPKGSLVVVKKDSVSRVVLKDATFKITYADGSFVPDANGAISSNGLYRTDENGQIILSGVTGTLVVTETESPVGYERDGTPQTVVVNPNDTQTLTFTNKPLCTLTILKRDTVSKQPLQGAIFLVTDGAGAPIGENNGRYTSGGDGLVTLTGLTPGQTVVVREEAAPTGYIKDPDPKTIIVKSGASNSLTFDNTPTQTLIIQKYIEGSKDQGLAGVTFLVTDSSGAVVGPNNGQYVTDQNGRITISGLTPGVTVTAKETKTVEGFVLDGTPQSILVKEGQVQQLTFYNKRAGGLELIKVDENHREVRISSVEFEIRKMDDGLVGTYTTDKRGRFYAPLEAGDYYLVETRAGDGYRLDDTPIYFTVADNKVTTKTVTNEAFTGILIHKVDSVTGKGIPDVTFLVYDGSKNPVDQVTTDQKGYAYVDDLGIEGRVYLRELEAKGYIVDEKLKTVYVRPGETTEITWENTPITGQIQITKYAAADNPVTGQAMGTALPGAVFEIVRYKSGVVVDYITTNARGVAVSTPLPLGRYIIREVTAPAYYQLSSEPFDVDLEFAGQIIRLSAYNKPAELGVTITKTGNKEVLAGGNMTYNFKVANNSNVALENFYWHDRIPTDAVTGMTLVTGTYSQRLTYRVLYKTNCNDYRVLASNLLTTNNYSFALNALPLQGGEMVTDVYFDFGTVPAGFQSKSNPMLTVGVGPKVPTGYNIVNRADVGGKYQGTWESATTGWVTIVRNLTPTIPLPKTGY